MSPKPATKKRVQDRGIQTRQRIVEEALLQFARYGFDGVGIREIAEAVGVQHGLIKYHFGTKDELWREAVRLLFSRIDKILLAPPEDDALPPVEAFARSLRRYIRYCAEHPEHARLMVQESFRDNERLEWAAKRFIRPSHDGLLPRYSELMRDGIMPRIDPVLMIYAMTGAAQSIFNLAAEVKHTHGIDAMSEEMIEAYSDAITAIFLPGVASAAKASDE